MYRTPNGRLFIVQTLKHSVRFKSKHPSKHKADVTSKRYSDTLNLPKTAFPLSMKNGAQALREEEIQKTVAFKTLYQWQQKQLWENEFVLHDGPPYANGKLHVGHVVNKVLKDITNRYKVLKKHRVHYVPGWDCHGMPIETKAITDNSGKHLQLSPLEIRARAQKFAEKALEEQKSSFLHWGIMGDWDHIYKTLTPEYEMKQLDVFYKIYEKGYIYRDYMPVYWSPSSQSALAEAELEYNPQHVSKSAYVKFPVISSLNQFAQVIGPNRSIYAVAWTTTPWTIPFNQALCYNPKLKYVFACHVESGDVYLCEESFLEKLKLIVSGNLLLLLTVEGFSLEGSAYRHPLSHEEKPFLPALHVVSGKGTGLVHTAPAHGHEDFSIAVQNKLPTECHVDGRGVYISGVDSSLLGKAVGLNADDAVLAALGPHVMLVEDITHSYPYDWRTKQPIIIRASKQWFINVQALRPLALESLSRVKVTPQQSENGMIAELNSRPYWCISRQRTWGVPMPVFYHKLSGEPLITRETVDHVSSVIQKHGSDCWWSLPLQELLPNHLLAKINRRSNTDYEKGEDILDIWFDSGISWASVLTDYGGQADVYLEGIDQYKGWFQTSLLTSVAVNQQAPYRQLITHGFATDEEGKKMSKSIGNVMDPEEVIHGGKDKSKCPSYGVDVLRWWVAHSHHHSQIMIGPSILNQLQEDVFKIRKCIRYLLGSLHDFRPQSDLIPYRQLTAVDKYMLYILYTTIQKIETAYDTVSYHNVVQNVEKFVYSDLSNFYISNTKDRCYSDEAKGILRKSSQTVQYYVIRALTSALAPIMPHLADEVYQHMPDFQAQNVDQDSIFKCGWFNPLLDWNNSGSAHTLMPVFDMRRSLLNALTSEMPLEFDLHIYCSPQLRDLLWELQPDQTSCTSSLCEIFQTSTVSLLDSPPLIIPEDSFLVQGSTQLQWNGESGVDVEYKLLVSSALLHLCERCRRYTAQTVNSPCERCLNALGQEWSL